jgi:transposase InsO family protein
MEKTAAVTTVYERLKALQITLPELPPPVIAESVIGLFKAKVIHRRGPWRGFDDVEFATLEWVWWFNHQRLMEPLGYLPPARARQPVIAPRETRPSSQQPRSQNRRRRQPSRGADVFQARIDG